MQVTIGTRAVRRTIEARSNGITDFLVCAGCGREIKWQPKNRSAAEVVANVYVDDKWNRVEHWHVDCYTDAGSPWGQALEGGQRFGATK